MPRMRGSTAVEFAMIFPLFFLILYGVVTFSLIFVAQQSLTLAAEEGARAALNYQKAKDVPTALAARASAACSAATGTVGWLAGRYASCVATPAACASNAAMQCVQVTLTYNYAGKPLVPTLPLLSLALPAVLSSSAVVQLNPGYLL
ncbi:pilus assembly protein [Paraburkholderia bonniea]|uniref:TadE/TadG family type IV pilus assembly protein n=1 Tax=Paraburkholderia bonniea TaxID=2152891 RepID=UPI0015809328|nr:TadE family protein [Paraburkholderia bonniea]WJF91398.1 pilus assembly protein [Paraburkholderia bonniea]WJF94715.1 pilus assembly protein [Paraburkholderia bonniea]